ncbi:hypothetical protein Gbth_038_002 [Gluconobacter thailandicus F149-1 = NBRC 100600]|uniref:hypothetical protein n=1 Tax=Gluconobacter thailandicus TaxID=257438 RepID=UPI00034A33BC|nr:hypothetical protein [Gluconobacter thailandicus]KXV54891.1 hypothetical protein AD946_01025 [Gluconobacter thailandicus]GAN93854.1 hypothetical protein Gbth_038_002 [Gluconobacter thailandicus F149-1 = NBRC 100600]GEL88574.1 hypothetical protein GTH01_29320 [Gluconobacter thailandicus F149-1 = NBRC 100600]
MDVLAEIEKINQTKKDRIQSYRNACSKTSHRQLFNTLNYDIDQKANGLTGENREAYKRMKAQKLAEADARDKANEEFWDSLL